MRSARLVLIAVACTAFGNGATLAGGVSVPMDEVTLVSFKQPVATVYLGNPSIAELTLVDARHVFVVGKRFGTTNLIALSATNTVVTNEPVTVSGLRTGTVTLNRGADSYNYTCTNLHCETRPVPGDPKAFFENTEAAAGEHEDTGTKAATAGTQTAH